MRAFAGKGRPVFGWSVVCKMKYEQKGTIADSQNEETHKLGAEVRNSWYPLAGREITYFIGEDEDSAENSRFSCSTSAVRELNFNKHTHYIIYIIYLQYTRCEMGKSGKTGRKLFFQQYTFPKVVTLHLHTRQRLYFCKRMCYVALEIYETVGDERLYFTQ